MARPALLSALFCAALGAGALAHQAGSVAPPVAERSSRLVDRLDTLFESDPASALSEIKRAAGSAAESERRDLGSWLDQRLPRSYLPMTKRGVDDASHRSVLEALARDPRLAVHVADLVDYVRIQAAAEEPASKALRPLLESYESSCRAWGACGKASMDSVVGDPRIAFVAALPTSRRVGLYNPASELVQTIDIGSPLFDSDGRSLGAGSDSRTWMLWGRTNSEINRVFAFGQVVATIHSTNDIPAA